MTLSDPSELHVYAWPLSAAQQKTVEDLTKKILSGLTSKQAKSKPTETKNIVQGQDA